MLGHAINYQQVLGSQENRSLERQYKDATLQNALEKAKREATKIDHSTDYTADGKVMRDYFDAQGNLVKRETIGEAKKDGQALKLVELPDGSVQSIDPQKVTNLPKGTKLLGTASAEPKLTPSQAFDQDVKLAGIDSMLSTGLDSKGNEVMSEALDSYAAIYNKNNSASQYVKIPGSPKVAGLPFTGNEAKWVKVPKSVEGIAALKPDTVLGRTSKGSEVTLEQIKAKANTMGISLEEALKQLGLVR